MKGIIGAASAFTVLLVILVLVFGSWGVVNSGHRGVVVTMGRVTGEIKGEGFYTKTPWFDTVYEMDCRIQKEQVSTECASKDLQTIKAVIALNLHPQFDKVSEIYQTIGKQYTETVVAPAMQESIKAAVSKFTAEELITKRETVREEMLKIVASKLIPLGIEATALNIVNLDFSPSFNAAIESKVTAEQEALAAKNKLEQKKFEAQQAVETAKGKAEALAVEGKALESNPQVIQMRALEKWDGKLPQIMGSGSIPFIQTSLNTTTN